MAVQSIRTHCSRMDHGGCSLLVKVENGRIVKIKPDSNGELNRGYLCPKAFASIEKLYHPNRLTHPLIRVGKRGENKWKMATWDEALDLVVENLDKVRQKDGARSVAFCQGMPKGMEHFVLIRLANLFGSPNVVAVQDVCHAPREITGIHMCGFYPVVDFRHPSELIILWGSNSFATNEEGLIYSLLLDRLSEGTYLIVVDPVATELAHRAHIHLPIRPGTDGLLALAMLNVIIEENLYDKKFVLEWTYGFDELSNHVRKYSPEQASPILGIEASLIREAARLYASACPSAIAWGNAIEQTPNNFDTVRGLICLMAICGNLDVPGGNIEPMDPSIMRLGHFARAKLIYDKPKEMIHAHTNTIPRLMTVPPVFFRKAVLEEIPYPVKAAYMQCTNPLLTWADSRKTLEALLKLDFLAVSDVYLTPTAIFADVVLPAASQFEFNDIGHYGLGHGFIVARPKLVDPPGKCWPDIKILNELGRRLTPSEHWYEDYEKLLEEVLEPAKISYAEFAQMGILRGQEVFRKYGEKGFRTPTGKVELRLSRAHVLGVSELPNYVPLESTSVDYPLFLTCRKDRFFLHSSYRWINALRKHSPEPRVLIHPNTARKYNIENGSKIFIETHHGRIVQTALYHAGIRQDVVVASHGWWFPEKGAEKKYGWDEANINIITSTEYVGKEFGTPILRGIPCRIGPINALDG